MKHYLEAIKEAVLEKRTLHSTASINRRNTAWNDFDEIVEMIEDIERGAYCYNCGSNGIGVLFIGEEKTQFKCLECSHINTVKNTQIKTI